MFRAYHCPSSSSFQLMMKQAKIGVLETPTTETIQQLRSKFNNQILLHHHTLKLQVLLHPQLSLSRLFRANRMITLNYRSICKSFLTKVWIQEKIMRKFQHNSISCKTINWTDHQEFMKWIYHHRMTFQMAVEHISPWTRRRLRPCWALEF